MDNEEQRESLMDDLASAWEEAEIPNEEPISADADEQPSAEFDAPSAGDDAGDGSGDIQEGEPEVVAEGIQPTAEQDGQPADGAEREGASLDTPPPSLSPTAREKWKDTPKEVKAEFARMDQRMEGLAQKFGSDAQRARGMDQALQPYHQFMAMNGGPREAIPAVLQTASILQMGSPQQKAEVVAGMIKQFGIDVRALDNAIVGEAPPPELQQQQLVQQAVQQAVAPYQQQAQAAQQQMMMREQQEQQQVQSEIQQFASDPANEFYHDVFNDMADILDMAANRNMDLSLKDAYDRACMMHPEISKIVSSRTAAGDVSRRKKASVSVSGVPGGSPTDDGSLSLHDQIASAWENAGRM